MKQNKDYAEITKLRIEAGLDMDYLNIEED